MLEVQVRVFRHHLKALVGEVIAANVESSVLIGPIEQIARLVEGGLLSNTALMLLQIFADVIRRDDFSGIQGADLAACCRHSHELRGGVVSDHIKNQCFPVR